MGRLCWSGRAARVIRKQGETMPEPIPGEVFRKELLDLLGETFERTEGIYLDRNRSLFETLAGLSAEQASTPVAPSGATIAGHVEHMAFYLEVLTDCILRKPFETVDWEESWRVTAVDEEAWATTKERLREAHRRMLDAVNGVETWEGEDDIGASLAILAHSAVHLGAIQQALHAIALSAA